MTLAVASADALPLEDDVATHILSVESLYYYASPAAALVEWARVARPGCELSIVIDLYVENPGSHPWIDALEVDVHLLSTADCVGLLQEAGWREVVTRQVRSERPPKPREAFEPSPYFPSYEQYLSTIETGSLVIEAKR
jgi:SAM-dependent methyltransferase